MYLLGLLALQQTRYSTLYIQDSPGCADYYSLFTDHLSERVSYSDYAIKAVLGQILVVK